MIIEKIGTGSSIADASENAKLLLAAPEDAEIHMDVIQDVKKKFLGLKVEPAKVRVWYEIPDAPAKTAPKAPETPTESKVSERKSTPAERPAKAPAKPPAKAPAKTPSKAPAKAPAKTAEAPAEAKKADEGTVPAEKTAAATVETLEISDNDGAANYIKMILEGMGITEYTLTLTKSSETNEYVYSINCQEDGTLIGRRGETLDAIQYLLRLCINKGIDDDKHRKVSVNIGNYREKRNDNLRALAHRSAKQVLKYGRNVVLDPMNPYERRIIHTAIQEIEGVTSHSTGVDAGRKVVISLEEGVKPTHPSKGGYGKGGGRSRRNGDKGGYQKKAAYQPTTTREPRKDSAGSLYGRIEIPAKNNEE